MIPVMKGATGTVSKALTRYLNIIPEEHEIKELKKTAILCTAHITARALM
jgi:hypothetical protein